MFERIVIGKLTGSLPGPDGTDLASCARNCFSCPSCESSLAVQASEKRGDDGSLETGPPYLLTCAGCKWTSKEVGWEFEKPTGLAGACDRSVAGPRLTPS